jgi:hypothetical protein
LKMLQRVYSSIHSNRNEREKKTHIHKHIPRGVSTIVVILTPPLSRLFYIGEDNLILPHIPFEGRKHRTTVSVFLFFLNSCNIQLIVDFVCGGFADHHQFSKYLCNSDARVSSKQLPISGQFQNQQKEENEQGKPRNRPQSNFDMRGSLAW